MCSRGVLVIAERAVRALDERRSEGWGERTLSMRLNMVWPTVYAATNVESWLSQLGIRTFGAQYQYTPSQDAQVRNLPRSINTKNVANNLIGVSRAALVKERQNS